MDESLNFKNMLEHLWTKVENVFSTGWGWVVWLALVFVNSLGNEWMTFAIILFALTSDMILGTIVSLKRGGFLLSYLIRETCIKAGLYLMFLYPLFQIEQGLKADWFILTKVACAIASSCELISIAANGLIIKPNFPFLKLFSKYLYGEIAKKLGIAAQEVEEALKNKTELTKPN